MVVPVTADDQPPPATVKLVSAVDSLQPGVGSRLGLLFTIRPKWHLYWRNPGEAGIPPDVAWSLPEGWTAEGPMWPAPKAFDGGGVVGYGYEGSLLLIYTVTPPAGARTGQTVKIGADVMWLACRDVCVPGMASLTRELPVAAKPPEPSRFQADFEAAEKARLTRHHDWRFEASRTADNMRLVIKPGDQPRLPPGATIEFFPQEPGLIGSSLGPLRGTQPASVTLVFDAVSDQHRALDTLLGVLTVTAEGPQPERYALALTVPIENEPTQGRDTRPGNPKE